MTGERQKIFCKKWGGVFEVPEMLQRLVLYLDDKPSHRFLHILARHQKLEKTTANRHTYEHARAFPLDQGDCLSSRSWLQVSGFSFGVAVRVHRLQKENRNRRAQPESRSQRSARSGTDSFG